MSSGDSAIRDLATTLSDARRSVARRRIELESENKNEATLGKCCINPETFRTKHMKVFGIGLSRTGTTSLTLALAQLGLHAYHFPRARVDHCRRCRDRHDGCRVVPGTRRRISWIEVHPDIAAPVRLARLVRGTLAGVPRRVRRVSNGGPPPALWAYRLRPDHVYHRIHSPCGRRPEPLYGPRPRFTSHRHLPGRRLGAALSVPRVRHRRDRVSTLERACGSAQWLGDRRPASGNTGSTPPFENQVPFSHPPWC